MVEAWGIVFSRQDSVPLSYIYKIHNRLRLWIFTCISSSVFEEQKVGELANNKGNLLRRVELYCIDHSEGLFMEDYKSAFIHRCIDTKEMYRKRRTIAAMHMGGITLECLLKDALVKFHGISEWKTSSKVSGNLIRNPGHKLNLAITDIPNLELRVNSNPVTMKLFNDVQQPIGFEFIDLRYSGSEPDNEAFDEWYNSYMTLLQWLIKQLKTL